jgi:hypothetical protein
VTMNVTQSVLNALCDVGRPIILRYVSADSCISSCNIGVQVLRQFNIRSHPIAVKFAAFNQKAHEFLLAGHPEWAKQERDGAYGVGAGYGHGPSDDAWDGHLVLVVRGRYLLDLSADQASRPNRGIHITPLWFILPVGGGFVRKIALTNEKGGTVSYEPDPANTSWRVAPDWKRSWDEPVREVTAAVRRTLKEAGV